MLGCVIAAERNLLSVLRNDTRFRGEPRCGLSFIKVENRIRKSFKK